MQERIFNLLDLYFQNRASPQELEELFALIDEEDNHPFVADFLISKKQELPGLSPGEPDWDEMWSRISTQTKVFRMHWRRLAVAAVFILLAGLLAVFYFRNEMENTGGQKPVADVSAPGYRRPQLVLGNGSVIPLDSPGQQLAPGIQRMPDGRLIASTASGDLPITQQLVRNPRGSRVVDLTLIDGTRLWLNAGSSIRFPSAFAGNERLVEISGEVYFEVSKDPSRPFIVTHGQTQTIVLGTGFNISAYPRSPGSEVTLVHGSVKVNSAGRSLLLQPGQQAILTADNISLNPDADIEKTIAWKNDEFIFENDQLDRILSQLEEWYDVEFSDPPNPALKYTGRLNRSVPLSTVLGLFEQLGHVQFAIHGKEVEVLSPKK